MRNRRLKLLLGAVLAPIILAIAVLLFERFRGQISLTRYKQHLVAQGERMSPRDFVREFSEDQNGAPAVISAIERLQPGTVLPVNPPPRMRLTPSGRAIVGFREKEWVDAGTIRDGEWVNERVTNRWPGLAGDLNANQAILDEIREGLSKPVLNNNVDLGGGLEMKFLHIVPPKSLTHWFGAASLLALHESRNRDALEYLLPDIGLTRLLAEDSLVISELVRSAIASIAFADTWEALQAEGWTDDDLRRLQEAWSSHAFATGMVQSLEGERVFGDVSTSMIRSSHQTTVDYLFGWGRMFVDDDSPQPLWERMVESLPLGDGIVVMLKEQVYSRVWRFAWSHQDQRRYLQNMQRLITIMRDGSNHKSYVNALSQMERFHDEIDSGSFYDTLRFVASRRSPEALSGTLKRAMRAETERSITLCAIAIERHFLRHSQYPETLDALVPEFLAVVPIDYMDGQPMRYRRNTNGGFTLYSVGEDGEDDGGDAVLQPNLPGSLNLWQRKDFVWPRPALPEEVEVWRRERAST